MMENSCNAASTAEGLAVMNDGEYYVSAENLAEDVQVGDIVTI